MSGICYNLWKLAKTLFTSWRRPSITNYSKLPRFRCDFAWRRTLGRLSAWWRSKVFQSHRWRHASRCKSPWSTWPRAKCRRCSKRKSRNSKQTPNSLAGSPLILPAVWQFRPVAPKAAAQALPAPVRPLVRGRLMTTCPSDETLAGLLADALSTTEQEALAQHVETCALCQGKLARLTNTSDSELWQRVENLPPRSDAEKEIVRRLKKLWRTS